MDCAIKDTQAKREKKERKEYRAAKEKAKSRADHIREAQAAFNTYIRYRDKDEPCISCGRHHTGQYHASHYYATSIRPNLRFDEANVHKACSVCNTYKHGNLIPYREQLIKKIGQAEVERLDNEKNAKKYSIDDLREIKKIYKNKLKIHV